MKKTILTAVFAALALGAAQALSVGWSYGPVTLDWVDDGSEMNNSHAYQFFSGTGPASYSVAAVIKLPETVAQETTLVQMGEWRSGNSFVSVTPDGEIRVRKEVGSSVQAGKDYSVEADGLASVIFTYEYVGSSTDGSGKSTVITAYVNGIEAWSWSNNDVPPGTQIQLPNDIYEAREDYEFSYAIYDGVLLDEQIAYLADEKIAVLPEPTALALLALGVAGVALRRKVA